MVLIGYGVFPTYPNILTVHA